MVVCRKIGFAIYRAFCPASVGPFVSRPLRLLTTSPASSSSFKVRVRGGGWTRWLREGGAREGFREMFLRSLVA